MISHIASHGTQYPTESGTAQWLELSLEELRYRVEDMSLYENARAGRLAASRLRERRRNTSVLPYRNRMELARAPRREPVRV